MNISKTLSTLSLAGALFGGAIALTASNVEAARTHGAISNPGKQQPKPFPPAKSSKQKPPVSKKKPNPPNCPKCG